MSRLRLLLGKRNGTRPPEPSGKLVPSPQWTGTASSGFGGSYEAAPVDLTRTHAKARLRALFAPNQGFAEDLLLVVEATAEGGIQRVEFYCEGMRVDVEEEDFFIEPDINGNSRFRYGHGVTLGWDEAMGIHAEGAIQVYAKAIPVNPSIMPRVIGPILFYPRQAGVGPDRLYQREVDCKPTAASDTAGVRYRRPADAATYLAQQGVARGLIWLVDDNTRYSMLATSPTARDFATSWTTLRAADGITAIMGNHDINANPGANWFHDGLKFEGAGIRFEVAAMASFLNILRGHSNAYNLFWLDGIEKTMGAVSSAHGGTGEGAQALKYGTQPASYWIARNNARPMRLFVTDVNAHDLAGYGWNGAELVLGGSISDVSGSCIENCQGAIHNIAISRIGGVQAGLREHVPAFKLAGPLGAKFQKYGQNGWGVPGRANSALNVWTTGTPGVDSPTFTLPLNAPGTSAVTTVQAVCDHINANWTGYAATDFNSDTILSAAFLSMADLPPSYSIGIPSDANANDATPRTFSETPFQLTTTADIHSNSMTWQGPFENITVSFVTSYDAIENAQMAISSVKDFSMRYSTFQDTSAANGHSVQNCVLSGTNEHLTIDAISLLGLNNSLQTQSGATFDAFSSIRRSALEAIIRSGTVDNDLVIDSCALRTGSTPSGATNMKNLTGAAETTMYVDPAATPPDVTALAALVLPDGKIAGRLKQDGQTNLAA